MFYALRKWESTRKCTWGRRPHIVFHWFAETMWVLSNNLTNISTHNSIVYWCQVVYEATPRVVIIVHLVFYLFCIQKSVGALSRTLKCKWGVQCNDKLGRQSMIGFRFPRYYRFIDDWVMRFKKYNERY